VWTYDNLIAGKKEAKSTLSLPFYLSCLPQLGHNLTE
jgi:hypothetical protein